MAHEKIERTLESIKNAFVDLVNEKGFNTLTVSDITRRANVNRGTFYNHYQDKYDLLEKYETEILDELNIIMKKGLSGALNSVSEESEELLPFDVALEATRMLDRERKLIVALLSDHGDSAFIGKVKDCFTKQMKLALKNNPEMVTYNPMIPKHYANDIVFNTLVSIVIMWLTTNQKETPEEIAKILTYVQFAKPSEFLESMS